MVSFRVAYTLTARRDLFAIGDHLSEAAGPRVAAIFIDRVIATADSLAEMPQRHRARDELGDGVRVISFRKYLLFYRVERETVFIVRVLHGARRITAKLLLE